MTDKQFYTIFGESMNYTDRDAFVSDWALSSMWDDAPDADIPEGRLSQIGAIWDAAHRSMHDIAVCAGLSHRKLAERFCIPYRSMEDWCSGAHSAPGYVRLMMQECLGLIVRK